MTAAPASLRPRFKRVLDYVLDYHEANGYAPSLREIVNATAYESTSAARHALQHLADAGYIRIGEAGQSRAIDVRPAQQRSR